MRILLQWCLSLALWAGAWATTTLRLDRAGEVATAKYVGSDGRFKLSLAPELRGAQFLVFYLEAQETAQVWEGPKTSLALACSGVGLLTCVTPLARVLPLLESPEGYRIRVLTGDRLPHSNFSFGVQVGGLVRLNGALPERIVPRGVDRFEAVVTIPPAPAEGKVRFQVEVQTTERYANLGVYALFQKEASPSSSSFDFSLRHLDGFRLGHVITGGQPFYCGPGTGTGCTYRLLFEGTHLHSLDLRVEQAPQRESIRPEHRYLDALGPKQQRTYLLQLPESDFALNDVKISLVTLEGRARLYANPQFVPQSLGQNMWRAEVGSTKTIVISPEERSTSIQNYTFVHIAVEADVPSSYYLRVVLRGARLRVEDLTEGASETLFSRYGEVKNLELRMRTLLKDGVENPPFSSVVVTLRSFNDHLTLFGYLKAKSTDPNLSASDIALPQLPPGVRYFEINKDLLAEKSLRIGFPCGKVNAITSTPIGEGLVQHECVVSLGVLPNKRELASTDPAALRAAEQAGATYEISYFIEGTHSFLHLNSFSMVRLEPMESRLLQLSFDGSHLEALSGLKFSLQSAFGTIHAAISAETVNPCDSPKEPQSTLRTLGGNQLAEVLFPFSPQDPPASLRKTYYLCLRAGADLSAVGVIASPVVASSSSSAHPSGVEAGLQHIPANQQMVGELSSPETPLRFAFSLNLNSGSEDFVTVHVNKLAGPGRYRIVVSSDGKPPSPTQASWNVVGSSLRISAKDPLFRNRGLYIVAVYLLPDKFPPGAVVHRFAVGYSHGSVHTLLREGEPFTAYFPEPGPQHFRLELPPGSRQLTFLKTFLAGGCPLAVSFKADLPYPTKAQSDLFLYPVSTGFHLDAQALAGHCQSTTEVCQVYMTLEVMKAHTKVVLAYSRGEVPILLHDNLSLQFPTMLHGWRGNESIRLAYHLPRGENFTLTCQNEANPYRCVLRFVKASDPQLFASSPEGEPLVLGAARGGPAFLDLGPADYGDLEVMLVTLTSQQVPDLHAWANSSRGYLFEVPGRVSITRGAHLLLPGVREYYSEHGGTWNYFRFHHGSQEDILLNLELISGHCSLSLWREDGNNPTEKNALKRTAGLLDLDVTVTRSDLPFGKSMVGDYYAGVRCPLRGTYGILYRPTEDKFLRLGLNQLVTVSAKAGVEQYLEFNDFGPAADLELAVKGTRSRVKLYVLAVELASILGSLGREVQLPTHETYSYKYESPHEGGIGTLVIPSDSPTACLHCKYVVLMKTDHDDEVEVLVRKDLPGAAIRLLDGKEYIGVLDRKKHPSHTYYFREPSFRRLEGLDLQIRSGQVTLLYSRDPTFPPEATAQVNQFNRDEFFRVTLPDSEPLANHTQVWTTRYLRLAADSSQASYSLSFIEDNSLTRIEPMKKQFGRLSGDFSREYFFASPENETVEVDFSLRDVYERERMHFSGVSSSLAGFVKVYSVKSLYALFSKKSRQQVTEVRVDQFNHGARFGFASPGGILILRVENNIGLPVAFTLELFRGRYRVLEKNHNSVGMLTNSSRSLTYKIPVEDSDQVASFQFNQCLQDISVRYNFIPLHDPKAAILGQTLFDRTISTRNVYLGTRGTLEVVVSLPGLQQDSLAQNASDTGVSSLGEMQQLYPTVFNLRFDMGQDQGAHTLKISSERFVVDQAKGVQVVVLDGSVTVQRVEVRDLESLLKEYDVFVNYTLYLSATKGMLGYLSHCQTFASQDAERFFQSTDYYAFSYGEMLTKEKLDKERKDRQDSLVKIPEELLKKPVKFQPKLWGFGSTYQATVVADLVVFPRQDTSAFPEGQQFHLSYGTFEYGGDRLGYLWVLTMVLFLLGALAGVFFLLLSHGIVSPMLKTAIMEQFSTTRVAENLVIEVADYRRSARDYLREQARARNPQGAIPLPGDSMLAETSLDESTVHQPSEEKEETVSPPAETKTE